MSLVSARSGTRLARSRCLRTGDHSLVRHCHSVGYCRSPGLWLFPRSVLVCRFRMPLWSGLVVRLLAARFGRRLDAVRCPWSPPRCGTRPARCAVRRLYPCAVRLPDWSPHAYIRMKISAMSTRTPITNHPSPGKLMSWIGPPRITLLLQRSYGVADPQSHDTSQMPDVPSTGARPSFLVGASWNTVKSLLTSDYQLGN